MSDDTEEKKKGFGDTLNGSDGPVQSEHEHSDNPPTPDEAPEETKPTEESEQ